MIALDIAEHFKTKVKPNGFKAQVVAPNRLAAIRYAKYLNDFHVRAYPIITTSANDGIEFKEAIELNQDQVTNSFKLPDGEPEVLGRRGHVAHRVRRSRGTGAVPRPGVAGTRFAPSRGTGQPALHS